MAKHSLTNKVARVAPCAKLISKKSVLMKTVGCQTSLMCFSTCFVWEFQNYSRGIVDLKFFDMSNLFVIQGTLGEII